MSNFEKWWLKQPDVDCRKCSQNGWLAALQWVLKINKSPDVIWVVKAIKREIAANENNTTHTKSSSIIWRICKNEFLKEK